jgi:hypothetical protein
MREGDSKNMHDLDGVNWSIVNRIKLVMISYGAVLAGISVGLYLTGGYVGMVFCALLSLYGLSMLTRTRSAMERTAEQQGGLHMPPFWRMLVCSILSTLVGAAMLLSMVITIPGFGEKHWILSGIIGGVLMTLFAVGGAYGAKAVGGMVSTAAHNACAQEYVEVEIEE